MNDTPRFAVIGTGAMAAAMMDAFNLAKVKVTAVGSRDVARGRQFANIFHIPTAGEEIESLLRNSEFDAVYIANASADHATTAIAALRAGKAVLCEKPLGLFAGEAEEVADVARQTARLCMEGIWLPFLPAYRRFLELARMNACGVPTHLYADFGYPISEKMQPRLFSPAAGGVLSDRGVYLIALALDLFGPVTSLDSKRKISASGVEESASLQLLHRGDQLSQLAVSFTSLMSNSATLASSDGLIRLEEPLVGSENVSLRRSAPAQGQPLDLARQRGTRQSFARGLRRHSILRRIKRAIPNTFTEYLSYGANPYVPQLLHFLGLLCSGSLESNVVSLEHSLNIQRVIDRARVSNAPSVV
jgi:predicted dehydrogenase